MIVVLAVLGFALGLILTRGPMRSAAVEERAAASAIAGTLRLARTRAIAEGRPVVVAFSPATHRVQAEGSPAQALPPAVGVAVVSLAGTAAAGNPSIRFAPDGSSTGGRVQLADGDRRVDVGVDWLTGRVRIAEP